MVAQSEKDREIDEWAFGCGLCSDEPYSRSSPAWNAWDGRAARERKKEFRKCEGSFVPLAHSDDQWVLILSENSNPQYPWLQLDPGLKGRSNRAAWRSGGELGNQGTCSFSQQWLRGGSEESQTVGIWRSWVPRGDWRDMCCSESVGDPETSRNQNIWS